jgi:hypothetical protein
MKTIVGRVAELGAAVAAGAAGFGAGCEHPEIPTAKKIDNAASKRMRKVISGTSDVTAEIASPGESKSIHEGSFAAIFASQNTCG